MLGHSRVFIGNMGRTDPSFIWNVLTSLRKTESKKNREADRIPGKGCPRGRKLKNENLWSSNHRARERSEGLEVLLTSIRLFNGTFREDGGKVKGEWFTWWGVGRNSSKSLL